MLLEYRNSFVLYESVYAQYERLKSRNKTDEADELITAVMRYGLYQDIPPDESSVWDLGFDGVIATISAAKSKYRQKISIPENDLRALLDEGYSQKEIAGFYNCSPDTIQRRMKEYGISNRTKPQNAASNYNENDNDNKKEDKKVYVQDEVYV